jgi:MYXO-CTERM domain-containing protein
MMVIGAAWALGALVACGMATPEQVEEKRAEITDGTDHSGHPAVGLLIFALSGGTKQDGACTATLVGAKSVLTAAHCLGYDKTAFVDTATSKAYEAAASEIHPKYDKGKPWLYDLGLVTLKNAPAGITPLAVYRTAPKIGDKQTLIGYGETKKGAKDNGVKRIAQNSIAGVQPLYFTMSGSGAGTGNACYGDSGGPTLVDLPAGSGGGQAVSGVLSYITGACGSTTRVTRMDLYPVWLAQVSGGDVLLHDDVPPTVRIDTPKDLEQVPPSFQVQVTADDDLALASVELRVDGISVDLKVQGPYRYNVTLGPGPHLIEAVALDQALNAARDSVNVTVPVDGGPPDVGVPDAGVPEGGAPTVDGADPGPTNDGSTVGDGADTGSGGGDGCAVVAAGTTALGWPAVLALLLALRLRRRRR